VYFEDAYMGDVSSAASAMPVTKDDPSSPTCASFSPIGYNSIKMTGNLVPSDFDKSDKLMSNYLSGQSSDVEARAKSPSSSLPVFDEGMRGLVLGTVLNGDETALVTGLDFTSATITPVDDDTALMDMVAVVTMQNPLGPVSPLDILTVDMTVTMGYEGNAIGSAVTGITSVRARERASEASTRAQRAQKESSGSGAPTGDFSIADRAGGTGVRAERARKKK
jgi:hypothetical protein